MKHKQGYWLVLPAVMMVVMLEGCGNSNVFKQLGLASGNGASTISNLESLLDDSGPGNPEKYAAVIAAADAIINSSTASTADRQKAYVYKGEALLGKNGITVTEIISNLDSASSNPFDVFNLSSVSANEVAQAALALNAASNQGDLSADQQITRMIANSVAISTRINDTFTLANDSVSVKGNGSASNALQSLVSSDPDGSGDTDDSLTDFSVALADSLSDITGLGDTDKETVNQVSDRADQADDLNGAVVSRNTAYKVGDTTYDFSDTQNVNTNITSALSTIFFGSN